MMFQAFVRRVVSALPIMALAACSDRTPVGPVAGAGRPDRAIALASPVPGQYDLEFLWSGTALTIVAHVRDAGGNAPEGGTVTLQYCSYNGYPTDDITQPDEAPSSACADRAAHWATLYRASLDPSGDVVLPFGPVRVVTVIGFRLRYTGEGSGVQNYTLVEDWYRPL